MKRIWALLLLLVALAAFGMSCSYIGSTASFSGPEGNGLWYSRNRMFFGSDQIFYCPEPAQAGVAAQCVEADIQD